ncbi:Syntenin-1 [Taenia solium]|eukprot:TsM_000103500 transcript=TsM_000103500 gene=TsM_000103500
MVEDLKIGFTRPTIPMVKENRTPEFNTLSPNSVLIHAPGGALDLSLYNYHPMRQEVHSSSSQQVISAELEEEPGGQPQKQQVPVVSVGTGGGGGGGGSARATKMKRFKRPRKSSVLERFIALLEDKRIMEDSEDAHQLEDIKMPRLRNVLNIIFITAGVCFLLAVVIVILYTTFASLEALTIGKEVDAQNKLATTLMSTPAASNSANGGVNYALLASEFLGLDLSLVTYDEYGNACYGGQPGADAVALHQGNAVALPNPNAIASRDPVDVSQAVREVTVRKNKKGIVGLQLRDQDRGVFISYVECDSPAAVAGLRFGDQILKIDSQYTAGMTGKEAMNFIKQSCGQTVDIIIRDRPLERVVTLAKDSLGSLGILVKNGGVEAIVKDSSAARNGVLTNSQLVEVNGINVLGLSDKKIRELIKASSQNVKVTLIPGFYYQHLTKK